MHGTAVLRRVNATHLRPANTDPAPAAPPPACGRTMRIPQKPQLTDPVDRQNPPLRLETGIDADMPDSGQVSPVGQ
jgi:hypothetical protein